MKVSSQVIEVKDLTFRQERGMLQLMRRHFCGVRKESFARDLHEKRWAVVIAGVDGAVRGFTTLTTMEADVCGRKVKAFYSGDTIVDRRHWSIFSIERAWTPFVFRIVLAEPECRWFWFFVSKGYRTFRYLPVHFKRYWPAPGRRKHCFESRLLDALAEARFGNSYDPCTGVVGCGGGYRLRDGVGDIGESEMKRRDVRFFIEKNPEWRSGAQLACLAELSLDNLRPPVLKLLKRALHGTHIPHSQSKFIRRAPSAACESRSAPQRGHATTQNSKLQIPNHK